MRRWVIGMCLIASPLLALETKGLAKDASGFGAVEPGAGATPSFSLQFGPMSTGKGDAGPSTAIFYNFSRVGESGSIYVWTGNQEFQTLCAPGSGLNPPEESVVLWRADVTLESYDANGASLDVHWSRIVHTPDLVDGTSLERTIRLRLREGERVVLDLVRMPSGTDAACDGATVTAEFGFQDAKPLANAVLEYDVWLVDRDRAGHETVDRVTPRGLQGRSIDYAFKPLNYGVDGIVSPSGRLGIELRGRVKGRARPDGRIDLVVDASRTIWDAGLGTGDGGGKQATAKDGETIAFELPALGGELRGLDLTSLLHGQQTSIRVTPRRVS